MLSDCSVRTVPSRAVDGFQRLMADEVILCYFVCPGIPEFCQFTPSLLDHPEPSDRQEVHLHQLTAKDRRKVVVRQDDESRSQTTFHDTGCHATDSA